VEFALKHADDPSRVARVGHDPERGLYVEVVWNGVPVVLDAADMDADYDPVEEIISLLINFGYLPPLALDETRAWLSRPSCWCRGRAPKKVRRVLTIVEALERAAGS
jgi:hypothetical protein